MPWCKTAHKTILPKGHLSWRLPGMKMTPLSHLIVSTKPLVSFKHAVSLGNSPASVFSVQHLLHINSPPAKKVRSKPREAFAELQKPQENLLTFSLQGETKQHTSKCKLALPGWLHHPSLLHPCGLRFRQVMHRVWQVICPGRQRGDAAHPQDCRNQSAGCPGTYTTWTWYLACSIPWGASYRQRVIHLFKAARDSSRSL